MVLKSRLVLRTTSLIKAHFTIQTRYFYLFKHNEIKFIHGTHIAGFKPSKDSSTILFFKVGAPFSQALTIENPVLNISRLSSRPRYAMFSDSQFLTVGGNNRNVIDHQCNRSKSLLTYTLSVGKVEFQRNQIIYRSALSNLSAVYFLQKKHKVFGLCVFYEKTGFIHFAQRTVKNRIIVIPHKIDQIRKIYA